MFPSPGLLGRGPETAGQFLAQAADAGIDYVCCGDHVSFLWALTLFPRGFAHVIPQVLAVFLV